MEVPLELAFHNMDQSDQIEGAIRRQVDRLEKHSDRIIGVHVTAEAAHKQPHKSTLAISLRITVPGDVIVAKREERPHESFDNNDVYGVIRDTFDAAVKQLDSYSAKLRRDVKAHPEGEQFGRVVRMNKAQDNGFIETPAGGSLFFHRAVVEDGDWDRLEEGAEVHYEQAPDEGPVGPQARHVKVVRPREVH